MRRVLIANRGEIALRIIAACRQFGVESVGVYSAPDRDALHVQAADRSVCIGPAPPAQSYLAMDALLMVALGTGCDAVHPGYGFLAENAEFATKCAAQGLTFVGPSAESIALMGDKAAARRCADRVGIPIVPGSDDSFHEAAAAREAATAIGMPLLLKARGGGGGRGMRVLRQMEDFEDLFRQASREAQATFGDPNIYLERFLERVRHVEVQIFADRDHNCQHLWERECSTQRRHQKLVEEAPCVALDEDLRLALCEAAISIATDIEYLNAGTVEFVVDMDSEEFFFIEMNTRIQVEHPVTEAVTGVDLVVEQLRIADGEMLSFADAPPTRLGHAIEWRINAEDPSRHFLPTPGIVSVWNPPSGSNIRLDSHLYAGCTITPYYDSLLAKLIVSGTDRADAMRRSAEALDRFEVEGVCTTIPFFSSLLEHAAFRDGVVHTRWVEEEMRQAGHR